jgi:small subunit ribosomal protein S13
MNLKFLNILDINISKNIDLLKGLNKIYGLGFKRINYICKVFFLKKKTKFSDIHFRKLNILKKYLETHLLQYKLKNLIKNKIKKKIDLHTYKGFRYLNNLPLRGQRTHTNANTCKFVKLYIDLKNKKIKSRKKKHVKNKFKFKLKLKFKKRRK